MCNRGNPAPSRWRSVVPESTPASAQLSVSGLVSRGAFAPVWDAELAMESDDCATPSQGLATVSEPPLSGSRGGSRSHLAQGCGGDDGNRTRVRGFADRSLNHSGTSPPVVRLAAPRGFEPRFTDPKSAVLPLDDGATPRLTLAGRPRLLPAGHENGAEDGTRTRDPHLGKVMLYQLSHFRPLVRHDDTALLVPRVRIELTTPASSGRCSTD